MCEAVSHCGFDVNLSDMEHLFLCSLATCYCISRNVHVSLWTMFWSSFYYLEGRVAEEKEETGLGDNFHLLVYSQVVHPGTWASICCLLGISAGGSETGSQAPRYAMQWSQVASDIHDMRVHPFGQWCLGMLNALQVLGTYCIYDLHVFFSLFINWPVILLRLLIQIFFLMFKAK